MPSTPADRARVLVTALAVGMAGLTAAAFLACGGPVVSLSGDQPDDGDGDGGIPGFGTVDADAIGATRLTCAQDESHANICCAFEPDSGLVCGEWIATPLALCPVGYAQYEDPVMCCTDDQHCEPGTADDAGDGGDTLHIVDAGSPDAPDAPGSDR